MCLNTKTVLDKSYGNLQSLLVFTYCQKDLLIDFVSCLLILTDQKKDSYNPILVIVNWLTKIVYSMAVQIIINILGFAKIIIDVVIRYHNFSSQLSSNGSRYSSQSFSHYYDIFLISNKSYQLLFIFRLMTRSKSRIV